MTQAREHLDAGTFKEWKEAQVKILGERAG